MKDFNDFLNSGISDELLAAYIDDNTTESENQLIENALNGDSMLSEAYEIAHDGVSFGSNFDWEIYNEDFGLEEQNLDRLLSNGNTNLENIMNTKNAFAIYGEDTLNQVSDYVRQSYPDTCAIKSQQLVLERFGIPISEEELRAEAITHGWYTPGQGTSMENVGKLLELHGVEVHQYVNGNICNLINELAQGHDVIMGVDSGELWHYGFKEKIEDLIPGIGGADHALIVSGVNTDNPKDVKVIITDPGTGDLRKEYSLSQFVDAANDSHFYMVTTDQAVPHVFDTFGEGIEHLPVIGNMTYDYFIENFAYLHDINNRPVFDEFISHMQSSPATSYFAMNDYSLQEDNGDNFNEDDDDDLDYEDIDDLDDLSIDL